jgi:hypothetical protein
VLLAVPRQHTGREPPGGWEAPGFSLYGTILLTDQGSKMTAPEADTSAVFRRAMWQATEQALRYDLDQAVLEALFDVLEAAALARDRAARDGDDAAVQPE